jgi:hypothetical protein
LSFLDLPGTIATFIVGVAVGLVLRWLEPKVRLVCWTPHYFRFRLPRLDDPAGPPFLIQTNSLTVQNLGRKTAEALEIVHAVRPDHFELAPPMAFLEETTPTGEHVIRIAALAPKEFFVLQLLSYQTLPELRSLRSNAGPAKLVDVGLHIPWPRWKRVAVSITQLAGVGALLYGLARLGLALIQLVRS